MSEKLRDPSCKSGNKITTLPIVVLIAVGFALIVGVSIMSSWLTNKREEPGPIPPPTSLQTVEVQPSVPAANNSSSKSDELAALAGTYEGTVSFPDIHISGKATLAIEGSRFTLQATGGKRLTGTISAKDMGEFIAVELSFQKSESPSVSSGSLPVILVRTGYLAEELVKVSLRATLTVEGWVLQSAPEEKNAILFVQNNCPPYPHCRPVRRCRPCSPKE